MLAIISFCVIGALYLVYLALHRREGLLSPLIWFLAHIFLYFSLAPLYQNFFSKIELHSSTVIIGFLVCITFLVYYDIFSRLRIMGRIANFTHKLGSRVEFRHHKVGTRVALGILFGLGIYLISIHLVYGSSLREVFGNPLKYRLEMGKGSRALLFMLQVQILFSFFFCYLAYRLRAGLNLFSKAVVAYSLFLLALSVSFGSRGVVISLFVQSATIYELFKRRLPVLKLIPVGIVAIIVFAYYLEYRNLAITGHPNAYLEALDFSSRGTFHDKIIESIINRADALFNFDLYVRAIEDGKVAFEYLSSFLNAPLQLVPRDIYPEKPYYFSSEMTIRLLPEVFAGGATYDFTGIGEWIHNFGFWALPFFSAIPAFLLAVAQRCWRHGDPLVTYVLIYFPLGQFPLAIVNNAFLNGSNTVWLPLTFAIYFAFLLCFLRMPEWNAKQSKEVVVVS